MVLLLQEKRALLSKYKSVTKKPLFRTGIDRFWSMVPDQYKIYGSKAHEGLLFTKSCDENNKQIIQVQKGSLAYQIDYMMPKMISTLVECGYDVIIDEVIFDDNILCHYTKMFEKYTVYFIGVKCDLEELERRETLRGNRELGLVNWLVDHVHKHEKCYDFIIDTTHLSTDICAQEIMNFIKQTPQPEGFKKLSEKL